MLDFNGATVIFQIINFGVLLAVLGWFFYRPLRRVMRQREEGIADRIAEADRRAAEAEAEREALTREREVARQQSERVLEEARAEAGRLVQTAEAKAHEEAARLLEDAARRIQEEERVAAARLGEEAREIAIDVAGEVVKRVAGPTVHKSLVGEFLQLDMHADAGDARALRDALRRDGGEAIVESAYPLSTEEIERLRNTLAEARKGRGETKLAVRVDESLVAGIRVIAGTMAVDFSVRRMLQDVRERAEAGGSEGRVA